MSTTDVVLALCVLVVLSLWLPVLTCTVARAAAIGFYIGRFRAGVYINKEIGDANRERQEKR